MKKNILKMGVIGMALVFTLGLSLNAMAANTTVKTGTTKAATRVSQAAQKTEPTAAELAKVKEAAAANYKKILDYFVGTGAVTQGEADSAYKLFTESTGRMDLSKLPTSVQTALTKLHETERNLTEAQRTALRTATQEYLKVEVQKLVEAKVISSDLATSLLSTDKTQKGDKGTRVELTATQRDALRTAEESARKSAIAKLQTAGTITSEQASMMNLSLNGRGMGPGMEFGDRGPGHDTMRNLTEAQKTALKTAVDEYFKVEVQKLVDSKVITSDIATDLLSTEKSDRNDKAELTKAQMDAIHTAHQQAEKNALEKLKTAGTITTEQATKLSLEGAGLGGPNGREGHGGPGEMGGRGHGSPDQQNGNETETDATNSGL